VLFRSLSAGDIEALERGGVLHDVGKIAMPYRVLHKSEPLDEAEWALMHRHTIEGERMCVAHGFDERVGRLVRATHERWDGGGYPDGVRGEEIPLEARIVSCCDAYDAMTTNRSYRKALPIEFALEELRSCAGTQFDPAVVEALVGIVLRYEPRLAHDEPQSKAVDEALMRLLDG